MKVKKNSGPVQSSKMSRIKMNVTLLRCIYGFIYHVNLTAEISVQLDKLYIVIALFHCSGQCNYKYKCTEL